MLNSSLPIRRKPTPRADLLVGRSGVGMMEMALARISFATAALVSDIDAGKA